MFGRYTPAVHTGTREERILGLLREYADIDSDAMMRMHAKDREHDRIEGELAALGVEVWIGDGVDEGYVLGREAAAPHAPACAPPDRCECAPGFRVRAGYVVPSEYAATAGMTSTPNRTIPLDEPDDVRHPASAGMTMGTIYAPHYPRRAR